MVNIDAPGSSSANLKYLGHRRCPRPIFPLDEEVEFKRGMKVFADDEWEQVNGLEAAQCRVLRLNQQSTRGSGSPFDLIPFGRSHMDPEANCFERPEFLQSNSKDSNSESTHP